MLEELMSQAFWIGLAKIIGVNIILSGDNAVVIALAARSLPAKQQKQAIFWGAGAAIVLRIVLTLFAVALLLLVLGLAISIPLVIFGATLLVKLMDRFPVIITIGGGLIGWVAGEMLVTDVALKGWLSTLGVEYRGDKPFVGGYSLEIIGGIFGVLIVIALGKWLAKRQEAVAESTGADS
jgi:predicted tellurium resistance membrane protein TerC